MKNTNGDSRGSSGAPRGGRDLGGARGRAAEIRVSGTHHPRIVLSNPHEHARVHSSREYSPRRFFSRLLSLLLSFSGDEAGRIGRIDEGAGNVVCMTAWLGLVLAHLYCDFTTSLLPAVLASTAPSPSLHRAAVMELTDFRITVVYPPRHYVTCTCNIRFIILQLTQTLSWCLDPWESCEKRDFRAGNKYQESVHIHALSIRWDIYVRFNVSANVQFDLLQSWRVLGRVVQVRWNDALEHLNLCERIGAISDLENRRENITREFNVSALVATWSSFSSSNRCAYDWWVLIKNASNNRINEFSQLITDTLKRILLVAIINFESQ